MILPPSSYHSMAGAHIIFNLSAMEETGFHEYRRTYKASVNKCNIVYAYTAGVNETTADGVFGGYAAISKMVLFFVKVKI